MKYPKRIDTHIKERKAIKILEGYVPDEWIIREFIERDYGIDLYVEITNKNGDVTGDLVALQVKGISNLDFIDNIATYEGLKVSTYNYWSNLPVIVFFVVVDLDKKVPYWVNMNTSKREMAINAKRKTFSISIDKHNSFIDRRGMLLFELSYYREKRWPRIQNAIIDSLILYNTLGPLYLYCRRQDQDKYVSRTIQFLLIRYYESFSLINRFIYHEKPHDLPYWYDKHLANILTNSLEPSTTFYYKTIQEMFDYMLSRYLDYIENLYDEIINKNINYWRQTDPYFVMQLESKPIIFDKNDWYTRYHFDEYENETWDLGKCLLEDL